MAQRELIKTWQEIEEDSPEQQRLYLESILQGREPISCYSDIKLGDHLVTKSGTQGILQYEHHFLCSGFDSKGVPTIIHSYETELKAKVWPMILTSYFGSGSSLWKKGQIQEASLQDYIKEEDLQAKEREIERVVWPEGLQRFSAEEVVQRARKRENEQRYNVVENNCESLVMWCLCDLNISLQVTPKRQLSYELATTVFRKMISQIPKICCDVAYQGQKRNNELSNNSLFIIFPFFLMIQGKKNMFHSRDMSQIFPLIISLLRLYSRKKGAFILPKTSIQPPIADNVFQAIYRFLAQSFSPVPKVLKDTPRSGFSDVVGLIMTVVDEIVKLTTEVYQMHKDLNDRRAIVKSRDEYYRKVFERSVLALFRLVASIAGMFVGQLLISSHPTPCGPVGAILGGVVGQILARIFLVAIAFAQSLRSARGNQSQTS